MFDLTDLFLEKNTRRVATHTDLCSGLLSMVKEMVIQCWGKPWLWSQTDILWL